MWCTEKIPGKKNKKKDPWSKQPCGPLKNRDAKGNGNERFQPSLEENSTDVEKCGTAFAARY